LIGIKNFFFFFENDFKLYESYLDIVDAMEGVVKILILLFQKEKINVINKVKSTMILYL